MAEKSRWDGWLSPRMWIPLGAVLGIAMLAAGVIVGWRWVADEKQDVNIVTCKVGEEGCQPRISVHWHADFALYIDGVRYDFNQEKFFSTETELINANVHIHAPRVNVVHVHRSLTSWDEFFRSITFELSDKTTAGGTIGANTCLKTPEGELCEGNGKTFKFIVNGVKVDGIALTDVTDLDRVLVSFGNESLEDVMRTQWPQVSDEACIPSGRCLERGIDKNEPCSKFDTTCTYLPRRERDREWEYV